MLKNKGKNKCLVILMTAAILLVPFTAVNTYAAETNVIYQKTDKKIITQGVTHENIVRFTTDGWYNFHVATVDLSNEYISVDTLTNTESVGRTASTKKLAEQRNAVAAVNTSFFTSSGSGNGFPVGAIVQSSDILCSFRSFNRYSEAMASFSINDLDEVLMDYMKVDMSLSSKAGAKVDVEQYNVGNKNYYAKINVFDQKWGKTAVGASESMPDIFQMVVENGAVTQFLDAQPATAIPENGFVAVTRAEGAKLLQQTFTLGDKVTLNISTTPDWTKLKMSISGSSMLVKDGVVPETFSFTASDVMIKSPKTAVGSSKDGKTLYLVTVDGRQNASIGLSQKDMALFMKSIGAYNAINMDGGGSTTMVTRPLGNKNVKIMNKPSDGSTRNVAVGIGVFTSAPEAPLAGIIVETTDRYIFTNATRAFTVKGYDKYFNPIDIDPASIKWSASGVKGTFDGNIFKPGAFGEGKITATVGKVTGSLGISVLSKPSVIELSSSSIKLSVGKAQTFSVKGINPRGYTATMEPADLTWKVSGKIGTFKDSVFTATTRGAGYIDASFGDTHAYCQVSVSAPTVTIVDKFEETNGSFQSYPETIAGSYTLSKKQKISGKSSGELYYDFTTNTEATRAAYMVLKDGGHVLNEGTTRVGLQVYNDHENSGWLRAEIIDANGKRQVVDLSKTMDWTGWKYLETSVENIKMPAKLVRIYQALVNPVAGEHLADAGYLYFDDLTLTGNGFSSAGELKTPENTKFTDEANKEIRISKVTDDAFRFGVMGQSRAPESDTEKNLVNLFGNKITKYLELGAVVGNGSHESVTSLIKKTPTVATHTVDLKSTKAADNKYSVTDLKNSRFIRLNTSKKGLRLSEPTQWNQFIKDLNSFTGKNVFIFMENSPDTFTDKLELALFKETISDYRFDTLRNVSVFYNGKKNECTMEKGVKYFETAGYDVEGLAPGKDKAAQYILITVKGNAVTYVYKPINS